MTSATRDGCGVVRVAGAAVGVPFVGVAVGALAITEAIRAVMNGPRFEVMDLNLRDPTRRSIAERRVIPGPQIIGYALSQ